MSFVFDDDDDDDDALKGSDNKHRVCTAAEAALTETSRRVPYWYRVRCNEWRLYVQRKLLFSS